MVKMKFPYSLVLFDIDGTLVDTDLIILKCFNYLYDKYNEGKRKSPEEIYYFSGPLISDTIKKEFPHMDTQFMLNIFAKTGWDLYKTDAKLFPYVKETLEFLKKENVKLGVITNKLRKTTFYCFDLLGILDYFDVIIAGDDVKEPKPSKEGIEKAMHITGILDKENVLYIGDNASDQLAAINASVDFMFANWGPRKINLIKKPEYSIKSFIEFKEAIDNGKSI